MTGQSRAIFCVVDPYHWRGQRHCWFFSRRIMRARRCHSRTASPACPWPWLWRKQCFRRRVQLCFRVVQITRIPMEPLELWHPASSRCQLIESRNLGTGPRNENVREGLVGEKRACSSQRVSVPASRRKKQAAGCEVNAIQALGRRDGTTSSAIGCSLAPSSLRFEMLPLHEVKHSHPGSPFWLRGLTGGL